MKKLILSVAVIAAVAMISCTSSEKTAEQGSAITSKIENCTNPDSLKAYVQEAKDYVKTLVNEGKVEQAKEYLAKIEPVVMEKAPALAGTLATVETALDKVADTAKVDPTEAVDSAKNAVTDSISSKAEAIKDAAADKIQEGKDAVAEKAGEVVEGTKKVASDVAEKASDAAQQAADKIKDLGKK